MAVRLKFGNDLNIFGGSRGAGGFLSTPVSAGGGYPAYGTVLSTANGVDYETGATVFSSILDDSVYNQICDVETKADGVGGSYVDWANATNIQYKAVGTFIATSTENLPSQPVEVPSSSGYYYDSGVYLDQNDEHNGSGGIQTVGTGTFVPYGNGTFIVYGGTAQTEVPSSSGNYYDNGQHYDYVWDGNGGYTSAYSGSYYNGTEVSASLRTNIQALQTEVPTSSNAYYDNGQHSADTYLWNGAGSYTSSSISYDSYFPFGTFITDQNCPTIGVSGIGLGYYWDGNNGNYISNYP